MAMAQDEIEKLSLISEMRPTGELVKDYTRSQDSENTDGLDGGGSGSRSDDEAREIEDYYNSQDRSEDNGGGGGGVNGGDRAGARSSAPAEDQDSLKNSKKIDIGTILEAAFVDPAYTWPPPEGEGRNAIELQASISLMNDLEEKARVDDDQSASYATNEEEDDDDDDDDESSEDDESLLSGPPQGPETDAIPPPVTGISTYQHTQQTQTHDPSLKYPKKKRWFSCCRRKAKDDVIHTTQNTETNTHAAQIITPDYEAERMRAQRAKDAKETRRKEKQRQREIRKEQKQKEKQERREKKQKEKKRQKQKEREQRRRYQPPPKLSKEERKRMRYGSVPEGILIYRLNTTAHTIRLLSKPHNKTNLDILVREMKVSKAVPSHDRSRRGIILTDAETGKTHTLVACEQRTAIAWLETMTNMLGQEPSETGPPTTPENSAALSIREEEDSDQAQEQYLNIANYSNKLIRSGALPGTKKGSGGAGGIYYSIDIDYKKGKGFDQEALESIAKRRAVIKDSWDFYRMICSLLRDKHKYDEVFRKMQLDPVYPYLNSMSGLNDPADGGITDKVIYQKDIPEYESFSNQQIAEDLVTKAEIAMPSLVEICKALAGSLGMEEVGVGPIKDVHSALRKAERKYQGDLLKVTDYCRALLVVRDFPALLALLELARDSFGPLIRRVKMSSLKSDHKAKPGGYRDCVINVELKEHICEIQVHLWPMWGVCGVDGFRHYRHCLEYNTDSFENPYESLEGLSNKTRAELIVMAEEAVVDTPIDNLEWYHEKNILDYFAEVGLFLKHGLDIWAEITLRQLIKLRTESPDIGPDHHETIVLYKYLSEALNNQGKTSEAETALDRVQRAENMNDSEREEAEKSLWESFLLAQSEALEMIMDPNKKERDEEETLKREVKASKKQWRRIRNERFKFLDLNIDSPTTPQPSQSKLDYRASRRSPSGRN